ncbi:MAG: murein biosynthesis integral membrane protein MurJ [Gammaproteobacteria bacterium]|nr:murein biosynthesis integral membrane protein MurJ [Gammaproteobacteria bacterium]NNM12849.1 murein biosynthesis integral membrane protein MurJ [Gammaproteobacteria bacterium]
MPKLLKSASVFGGWTFISRILGLVRDVLFARFFGATYMMDVFKVTFSIPNYFRRLFGEGAFLQSFVPVLNEYKEKQDHAAVKDLVDKTSGTLGFILFIVSLLGVLAAPVFILLFAPGFYDEPEKWELSIRMLRWMFPYLLFISLTALAAGILNTYNRFAVPAFTPILLNLILIGFVLYISPQFETPVYAIAIGVFLAGIVQLVFQFPFLRQLRLLPRPKWGWKDSGVRKIFRLMIPGIFGSSVAQLNLIIDTAIASLLATGSISWLFYSNRLMEFPLGIFGIAIATVALPRLSSQFSSNSTQEFSRTLDWSLRMAFVICLPAAVGLLCLAGPMLATLFQYGEFTTYDMRMARYSLWAYGLGLFGFVLVKVLVPGYFSRQDTVTPVKIGIVAIVVNISLNVIVLSLFLTGKWTTAPHAGLAAATSLGAFVNAVLLYRGLRKRGIYTPQKGWWLYLAKVVLACVLMGLLITFLAGSLDSWASAGALSRISRLATVIGAGVLCYFASLFIMGIRPGHFLQH